MEKIVYRNADNGYTVLQLSNPDTEEELTCVGSFAFLSEGEYIQVSGNLTTHPLYGEQLQITGWETTAPKDKMAMERYLASGAIKGIGPALAARIVRHFGDKTFAVMEREPERLAEIKGITDRKAMEIYEQFREKQGMRAAMLYLQRYGISTNLSVKLYKRYGEGLQTVLEQNPYRIVEDISGVGFKTADEIAIRMGIAMNSEYRIRAGILHALYLASQSGHVYLPEEELFRYVMELLGVELEQLEHQVTELILEKKLIVRESGKEPNPSQKHVYLAPYYFSECAVARMLHDLNVAYDVPLVRVQNRMKQISAELTVSLDEIQEQAVYEAMRSGLFVLTGGPGTGKTTTINAIIRLFELEGMDICLAAPTGRAAKRMTEATGMEARTIHRMLEVAHIAEGEDGGHGMFGRNEEHPLEADVVIIDEMSMVDMHLMLALLKAVPIGCRLILVGDSHQLPSVGPGNVLKDIMDSGSFSVVRLTKIFRQAEESDIVLNAHKINAGQSIALDNKSKDFFLLKRYDPTVIQSVVLKLVRDKLPKYVEATAYDVQVLTPMRKGELGVETMNRILQKYLNPEDPAKAEYETRGLIFREGDKVMQVRNNYQLEWEVRSKYGIPVESGMGIYNGDMGVIRNINRYAEEMEVVFDENHVVMYPFAQLEDLEHAYAVTIHKSQGSEYPAVVLPLLTGPRVLMNRNLLYTAVTRASKCVSIVGSEETVRRMIVNENEQKRYTGLCERIREMKAQYD